MLIWFFMFFLITSIAGIMGFSGIAGDTEIFAKIVFYLFLACSLLALILELTQV